MRPGRLTIVIGLPGAGKSTWIKARKSCFDGEVAHDFMKESRNNSPAFSDSRHHESLIKDLKEGRSCVVADIRFCKRNDLADFIGSVCSALSYNRILWMRRVEKGGVLGFEFGC